jgi:large subunit ribosomal protein L30e
MIDEARALRVAVETGQVVLGVNQVQSAVRSGTARLIVLANNCPEPGLAEQRTVKVHQFNGTNADLGTACGKPFSVSALAVLDPGESNILSL